MHIKITKMPTCQHVNILFYKKSAAKIKYFRSTDLRARRRAWSLAEADVKGD